MSAQLPPPQPEPAPPAAATPAPPVPDPAGPGPSGSGARLRKLYVSGAAIVVLAAWGALFVFDRTSGPSEAGAPVTATATPTPTTSAAPQTAAERAVASVGGAEVDDKRDGTLVVTLDAGPAGSERAARVARTTYDLLQALADGDVNFDVVIVRGTAGPAGDPAPTAAPVDRGLYPEVYKASFTSEAVYDIDFDGADRASLDGLREHSVNGNLTLEGE